MNKAYDLPINWALSSCFVRKLTLSTFPFFLFQTSDIFIIQDLTILYVLYVHEYEFYVSIVFGLVNLFINLCASLRYFSLCLKFWNETTV